MHPLARILQELQEPSILVVGDLILDRYIEGTANRVSPEAPVLVFESSGRRYRLGGAGNVAANLVSLGARTTVMGVIGEDAAAEQLKDLLQEGGIDISALVVDESRPTTRKTRYVSRTAQVLRVDEENRQAVDGDAEQRLLALLAQRPFPYEAVLVSDYGKGMVTRRVVEAAVAAGHSAGGPVVVDPKNLDYSVYHGVDLLTPNLAEAELATGISLADHNNLPLVADKLRELTGVKTATVTLGKDGIFYESAPGKAQILPTEAKAVFDVTGAGDTVVAMLTLAQACGLSMHDSVRLANLAAGVTVGCFGTYAVSRQELLMLLGQQSSGKVMNREEAISIAASLRAEGRRLVFTNGCFDILHPGHTEYLARARAYGDALLVGVNTDASVQRQDKGSGRPVVPLQDRLDVLAALEAVDYVVPFDEDTPKDLIEAISPHVLVKGEDWRDKGVVGREWVENQGGQVVLVPLTPGRSTSAIIQRIQKLK